MTPPARVTGVQWFLLAASLAVAAVGLLIPSPDVVVAVVRALAVLSAALVLLLAREALRARLPGKLLLAGSCLLYFWWEALVLGARDPPFSIPDMGPLAADVGPYVVPLAVLYVALFQFMLFAGYALRLNPRTVVGALLARADRGRPRYALGVYILAAFAWVPVLATFRFSLAPTFAALVAARQGVGGTSVREIGFLHYLSFFGLFGAALLIAEGFGARRRWTSLAMGLAAAAPYVMLWGTRFLTVFIFLPGLILWLRTMPGRPRQRDLLPLALAGLLVVVLLQLQLLLRDYGWNRFDAARNFAPTRLLETGQFAALVSSVHLVPRTHEFFLEPVEPYFLIHWVPRTFWPDKPIMRSWQFFNDAFPTGPGFAFNVTPSVIGQYHLSWGAGGVLFIGGWLGLLAYLLDRTLAAIDPERQRAVGVFAGFAHAFIVVSFRQYSPIYFTFVLFGLIAMLSLTRRLAPDRRLPRVAAFGPRPALDAARAVPVPAARAARVPAPAARATGRAAGEGDP